MKAMILAAGRGQRMRPLTDTCPKPLLQVGQYRLIEYHLLMLKKSGFSDVMINLAWLGDQIKTTLGNGDSYGLNLHYSYEGEQGLETAGGIFKVLDFFDNQPFWFINGDVKTNYTIHPLKLHHQLAHLVMVNNPPQHPQGDFHFQHNQLTPHNGIKLTFSGIGCYHPALFKHCTAGKFPLAPLLIDAIQQQRISAEHFQGEWDDIGTPERLAKINQRLLVN